MLTTKYSMFMSVRAIATERTLRGYFSDVKSNLKKTFSHVAVESKHTILRFWPKIEISCSMCLPLIYVLQ